MPGHGTTNLKNMKSLNDYTDAFLAIKDFESALCNFTGAAYCVTTDCCTHAIEIALRLTHNGSIVSFPARTYLSVLMTMHKLGIKYQLEDQDWKECYQIKGTQVWDCARLFKPNMYIPGTIQCLSFGRTKPLQISRGGCILTDSQEIYNRASKMRYDGRDIFEFSIGTEHSWAVQKNFEVGYHYYLRPEDCVTGLNLLEQRNFVEQLEKHYNYPDCREIIINKNTI
jgi:dTDP-4-amino-4,6-dideoxygalactose transaminase